MKRVTKMAVGLLAALILGVSSLGVSRVWAIGGSSERSATETKVQSHGTELREQQDITSQGREIDQVQDVVQTEGVRDLTLSVNGELAIADQSKLPAVVAKTGVNQARSLAVASDRGVAMQKGEQSIGFGGRVINGALSFIKGKDFRNVADGSVDRAEYKDAMVPVSSNVAPEAMAATSLKPKPEAPKFNVPLAIDTALVSSTGVAAYTNVITDHLPAIAAILGAAAFWVFFAGPANAWQIVVTLPSVLSHTTALALSSVSAAATAAAHFASAINVGPVAFVYDWTLQGYHFLATQLAAGIMNAATFFSNLGTALMPNVHFTTSFPTVMSYAPIAAWGYGVGAVATAWAGYSKIMATFENVGSRFGYVIGSLAASAHIAIAPVLFVGKVLNEVIRPVIQPFYDFIKDVIWPPIKSAFKLIVGRPARSVVPFHVMGIAGAVVALPIHVATLGVLFLDAVKHTAYENTIKGKGWGGLLMAALQTVGLGVITVGAVYGLATLPAYYGILSAHNFLLLSAAALAGWGAIHGAATVLYKNSSVLPWKEGNVYQEAWQQNWSPTQAAIRAFNRAWNGLLN